MLKWMQIPEPSIVSNDRRTWELGQHSYNIGFNSFFHCLITVEWFLSTDNLIKHRINHDYTPVLADVNY
ncbi:MAG: hypothetical protein F6K59_27015 [Moorea sp. SIO3F7]|nr:hypothetical protein [Moorena sp. SIO3E8]NEQ02409.1 hypothetical protein [Moorena sp. SIO3F7]